jgi:cytoskeleton protein RodZ
MSGRHILMVQARELTWLAVRVDGGDEHEVLLREGEMVRWGAVESFLLTVGNAGGVDLVLDGQPVRVPGRRGEVVRNIQLPSISKPSP